MTLTQNKQILYSLDVIDDAIEDDRKIRVEMLHSIPGYEKGRNLPKHMAEHVYMFSGEGVPIKMQTSRRYMDDLVDWFGKELSILRQEGDQIVVRVKCNEQSMLYWALQYGRAVEILEPQSLRNRIRNILDDMVMKYSR